MNVGVLGTGMVGLTIASKLVSLGHSVAIGSRTADNAAATKWAGGAASRGRAGTFADAAVFGDVLFNCTRGAATLSALRAADAQNLSGKVLIDVANVLPPDEVGPRSLGEQIQDAFPAAKVVKALNTMNCDLMVNPSRVAGRHTVFVGGNDAAAKQQTTALLESFGWVDVIDLGDITTARATEAYLRLWMALWRKLGTAAFNVSVVR
jgi:8-hydroxy-5-deazaflavin:NADPH oxidoreductase